MITSSLSVCVETPQYDVTTLWLQRYAKENAIQLQMSKIAQSLQPDCKKNPHPRQREWGIMKH